MAIQNSTRLEVLWKISYNILEGKKKDGLHLHMKGKRSKWVFEEWVIPEKMEMNWTWRRVYVVFKNTVYTIQMGEENKY